MGGAGSVRRVEAGEGQAEGPDRARGSKEGPDDRVLLQRGHRGDEGQHAASMEVPVPEPSKAGSAGQTQGTRAFLRDEERQDEGNEGASAGGGGDNG